MKIALKGLWDSAARTFVPLIVGGIIGWLVRLGLPLDSEFEGALFAVMDLVFAGLYWLVVRLFEVYVSPKFSVLLGSLKQPVVYAKPDSNGVPVITDVGQSVTGETIVALRSKNARE